MLAYSTAFLRKRPHRIAGEPEPPVIYIGRMSEVTLTGELVCASSSDAEVVERMLPQHVLLTRAEPGCLHFEVTRRGSSLVWDVTERFDNEDAFRAHQERVAESAWGVETALIRRDYTVTGLTAE